MENFVSTNSPPSPPDSEDPLLRSRDSLNPYRTGLGLLVRRLLWDLNPRAWSSARNLKLCRATGAKQGKKAVILCNGPSLNDVDFDLLDNTFIFGLNKINLIFPKTHVRPNAIVAVNPFVIEQNKAFFETTSIPLYLDYRFANSFPSSGSRTYLYTNLKGFARDAFWGVDTGNTVTYVALQLAFHMGFTDVALVGCDHKFAQTGPENKVVSADGEDESHFDPNYFSGGVKWQLPDLFKSEVAYMTAKKQYEAHGRRVVNCTKGGRLEIFPRQSLHNWLNQ